MGLHTSVTSGAASAVAANMPILDQNEDWVTVLAPATLPVGIYDVRIYSPVTENSAEPRIVSSQYSCRNAGGAVQDRSVCQFLAYGFATGPESAINPRMGPFHRLSTASTASVCGSTFDTTTVAAGFHMLDDAGSAGPTPEVSICDIPAH